MTPELLLCLYKSRAFWTAAVHAKQQPWGGSQIIRGLQMQLVVGQALLCGWQWLDRTSSDVLSEVTPVGLRSAKAHHLSWGPASVTGVGLVLCDAVFNEFTTSDPPASLALTPKSETFPRGSPPCKQVLCASHQNMTTYPRVGLAMTAAPRSSALRQSLSANGKLL